MSEELAYAEMLEIPVSTVNVTKKKSFFKRKLPYKDLKEQAVQAVNERFGDRTETEEIPYTPVPESVSEEENKRTKETLRLKSRKDRTDRLLLGETIATGVLAIGIFACNLFMPQTLINEAIASWNTQPSATVTYADCQLVPVVSDTSNIVVSVSDAGVISFTGKGSVYPVSDGVVTAVRQTEGTYTVEIAHTDDFTSVMSGVDQVYYQVGDTVKGRVPVAYTKGTEQVRISLFNEGRLLDCYTLSGALPVWKS